jgi:hypothetical protein
MVGQCGDGPCGDGGQRLVRKSRGQSCEGSQSPPRAVVLMMMMMMMMIIGFFGYYISGVNDCNELRTEKRRACTNIGKLRTT